MSIYARVIRYYRPYLPGIVLALGFLLASIAFNLLKPWPVKWVIDILLPAADNEIVPFHGLSLKVGEAIAGAALSIVVIYLLNGLFSVASGYMLSDIGLKALLQLRTQMYACLQNLPLHFHDRRRSGDSTYRVAYDTQAIQTIFNRGFTTILGSVVTLVGTFAIMFAKDRTLALFSLAVVPFLWATIAFYAGRIRTQSSTLQQEESDVLAAATEGLSAIRVVHAFGRQEHEVTNFTREARQSYGANLKLTLTNTLSSLAVGLISAIGTALILFVGVRHVIENRLDVGDLYLFLSYLVMLYQPLEQLSYTAWSMEGAAAGMQRVFEVLDTEDTVPEKPDAPDLPPVAGQLELRGVSFQYEAGSPILRDFSLVVPQGRTVALVGGTGAGKTTVLSLVPRFYDPTSGTVRIDGHDLRDYSKKSVRESMAIVLQDTLLLTGTVEENIAYGRLGATAQEIRQAAMQARAHDFIMQLPQGYATLVGERGVRLSGGQRQRLGIARAFLKNAPILLLDEPTSALDLETEAEIMDTLGGLMRVPTTLIVTHRLNTIHQVDRIYVMAAGAVVEEGTGPELLAKDGLYARLWRAGSSERRRPGAGGEPAV